MMLLIAIVNLLAQFGEVLCRLRLIADDEGVEDVVEHVGRDLLCGITPGIVGSRSATR
jgi:hypothetical protein